MTPGYYRPRVPTWLWIALLVAAGLFAIVQVSRLTLDAIREDARSAERQRVYAEMKGVSSIGWPVERAALQRRIDSLRNTVVVHDSANGAAVADARMALAALTRQLDRVSARSIAIDSAGRHDARAQETDSLVDSLVASAQTAIRSCTVAITRCDSLRALDRAAFDSMTAAHAEIHAKDTTKLREHAVNLLITRDTLRTVRTELGIATRARDRRPSWLVVGGATVTGSVIGVALCALLCR